MVNLFKRSAACAIGFAALVSTGCALIADGSRTTPGASDIYDAYLRARGGEAALTGLAVIEREGWISVSAGEAGLLAGSYHTCLHYPDRVAIEIDAGPWRVAQALRADGAVECGPGFRACRPASDDVANELRETAAHANKDLLDEASAWRAALVTPTVDGLAWRLRLAEDGARWAEFMRDGGQLRALGIGPRVRHLRQWQVVSGVSLPYRLEDYTAASGEVIWTNTVQLREARISTAPSQWCVERLGNE